MPSELSPLETFAVALIRSVETGVIPPSYSSPDGLPQNEAELDRLDEELYDALQPIRGQVAAGELISALVSVQQRHRDRIEAGHGGLY